MKPEKLFIVIPALNEAARIREVILKCRHYGSVVVVDDGSSDDTFGVASAAGAAVLRHLVNLGKGAALKTGAEFALLKGADALVFIDADGQHAPSEIPALAAELAGYDVVFGVRAFSDSMPVLVRFGNWLISYAVKLLFGVDAHDTQCGFRAMTADAYRKVRWSAHDYSVESEMIANIGRHHLSYAQVGIRTIYKERYKGTTIIDGFKIVKNLLWWRLSR